MQQQRRDWDFLKSMPMSLALVLVALIVAATVLGLAYLGRSKPAGDPSIAQERYACIQAGGTWNGNYAYGNCVQ